MKQITDCFHRKERPVRLIQFGEGAFLRAFVDDMIDRANEKGLMDCGVAVIKPRPGELDAFKRQDNLYTVSLRGKQNGKASVENRVVTCIQQAIDCYAEYDAFMALAGLDTLQMVVSNTTEAGIVFDETERFEDTPPNTYPGKLTKFLYERYRTFSGAEQKGLFIIPVELIERNGEKLKACVLDFARLWKLGADFERWVENANTFCSTLVDRIVTGYPQKDAEAICAELGYEDVLLDAAEPFALWVIESGRDLSGILPLDKAGLPVLFTGNQRPYRERKVRILNGAHTSSVLAAYLAGKEIVRGAMEDPLIRAFMERAVLDEIVPTVPQLREEAAAFAEQVFERFENPFVDHAILSIALNSVSKWRARVLPSLRDSLAANGCLPQLLTFSLAALLAFYTSQRLENGALIGMREGERYEIHDDLPVLECFAANSGKPSGEFVPAILSRTDFWGEDLTTLPGFTDAVAGYLEDMRQNGMRAALEHVLST